MLHSNSFKKLSISLMTLWAVATFDASNVMADVTSGLKALEAKKYNQAAKDFSKSFKGGDADGAFYLGRMLELGIGGPRDSNAAIALYVTASEKGSALAKNRLGLLHLEGKGVLQDFELGAKLVCDAAKAGDVNGQFNCGMLYLQGKGVAKDSKAALKWIKQASQKGHIGAMNQYAHALMAGKLVTKNPEAAVVLYQKTAAAGNAVGLYSLGQAMAIGLGTEKNIVKAHAYFNLAAALNHPAAIDARELLQKSMTSAQILKAQQFARAWRPTPGENGKTNKKHN